MSERIKLQEETAQDVLEQWRKQARNIQNPDELLTFIKALINDYAHDYGTIVHATAAAMMGAMHAVDRSEQGGITGFQASCVGWEIIPELFGSIERDAPARIVSFRDALYPQNSDKFNAISKETWEWLQEQARRKIAEDREMAHPEVLAHWQSIVAGNVPFGLLVK